MVDEVGSTLLGPVALADAQLGQRDSSQPKHSFRDMVSFRPSLQVSWKYVFQLWFGVPVNVPSDFSRGAPLSFPAVFP